MSAAGTYEVYIDVRHHPRHLDLDERRLSTAYKLTDTGDPEQMVADALRHYADKLDPPATSERGESW